MTVGIYFEKFLFVLAGVIWGLHLLGAAGWVIGVAAAAILGIAVLERVSSHRKQLRPHPGVERRLL